MNQSFEDRHNPDKLFGVPINVDEENEPVDTDLDRAFLLAMAAACANPNAEMANQPLEMFIEYYTRLNQAQILLLSILKKFNFPLYREMTSKKQRPPVEVPSVFEEQAVPSDFKYFLYPGSTLVGYAAPRILLEYLGSDIYFQMHDKRLNAKLQILRDVVDQDIEDPIDFIILFAEEVLGSNSNVNPTVILSHLLCERHVREGLFTEIDTVIKRMQIFAPVLWSHYLSLTKQQKIDYQIISRQKETVTMAKTVKASLSHLPSLNLE